MSEPSARTLSIDLAASIADPACALAVAEVRELRNVVDPDGVGESGLLDLEVIEVLRGPLRARASLAVPFARAIDPSVRLQDPFNAWGSVPLVRGARLVLALRVTADPTFAIAASGATPEQAPPEEVKRCLAIRALEGEALVADLARAIADRSALVAGFAVTLALGLPRETCLSALEAAARGERLDREVQERIARGLASPHVFQTDRWAERQNVRALEALARGLLGATTPELRGSWLHALAGPVRGPFASEPAQDRAVRRALLGQMRAPSAAETQTAIEKLASAPAATTREAAKVRDAARALLQLWRPAPE